MLPVNPLTTKRVSTGPIALALDAVPWWIWVSAGNLFFLAASIMIGYLPESIAYGGVHHFDLAIEMNAAVWWSGATLLTVGMFAYQVAGSEARKGRAAWVALALLMVVLFIDEVGSIHERTDTLGLLEPITLSVAGLMVVSFLLFLFRSDTPRMALWLAVAYGLFFFVAVQEQIEQVLEQMGDLPAWTGPIRVGIEEGTELLGIFILWAAIARWRKKAGVKGNLSLLVPNPGQMKRLFEVLAVGLVLHGIACLVEAPGYQASLLGTPLVLYPLGVFLLLFFAGVWRAVGSRERGKARGWALLAGLMLVNSLAAVYIIAPRQEGSGFNSVFFLSSFPLFYTLQAAGFGVLYFLLARGKGKWLEFAALAAVLVGAWVWDGLLVRFLAAGLIAFLLFLVVRPPAAAPQPERRAVRGEAAGEMERG